MIERAVRMFWAAPCSLVGLALAVPGLCIGGSVRRVGHTLEVAVAPTIVPCCRRCVACASPRSPWAT